MVPPHLVQPGSSSAVLLLRGYTKWRGTIEGCCHQVQPNILVPLLTGGAKEQQQQSPMVPRHLEQPGRSNFQVTPSGEPV